MKLEAGKKTQMTLPRVLGHEFSGTVVEEHGDAGGLRVGDPVVVAVVVPCLDCESYRRGYHEVCDEVEIISFHCKECMVVGTSNSAPRHVRKALEFIETGQVDMAKYITHRFALADINEGLGAARRPPRLKVLIKP